MQFSKETKVPSIYSMEYVPYMYLLGVWSYPHLSQHTNDLAIWN